MKSVVFGSINMDLVVTTPQLPKPGETLTGHTYFTAPGGKGANQAVAAARLGAETVMIGRVGNDAFAGPLRDNLAGNGVDTTAVQADPSVSSGVALIQVEDSGENTIVIIPGSNGTVGEADVERLAAVLAAGDILLLQLEVPLEAVIAAAKVAVDKGAMLILDPAPARELPDELIALATLITPNETEAGILTGITVNDRESAQAAAQALLKRGAKQVLVKLGADGAIWADGETMTHVPAFSVKAIDTVAAGDASNGGIAAGLCAGLPLADALAWGMAAGGLATTKRGAQQAMPTRAEVEGLVSRSA